MKLFVWFWWRDFRGVRRILSVQQHSLSFDFILFWLQIKHRVLDLVRSIDKLCLWSQKPPHNGISNPWMKYRAFNKNRFESEILVKRAKIQRFTFLLDNSSSPDSGRRKQKTHCISPWHYAVSHIGLCREGESEDEMQLQMSAPCSRHFDGDLLLACTGGYLRHISKIKHFFVWKWKPGLECLN